MPWPAEASVRRLTPFERNSEKAREATASHDEPEGAARGPGPVSALVLAAEAKRLPPGLAPELRKIVDTAVARVAEIELDAIRQAQELTQRSEEGREVLRFALDRAFHLMNSLELLSGAVDGMVAALRIEINDTVEALRQTGEHESELSRELNALEVAQAEAEQERPPAPIPATRGDESEAAADGEREHDVQESANGDIPGEDIEPSPELTEMFRERITDMRRSGKPREEAERSLLRFNLGRRFLYLIDEIYAETPAESGRRSRRFGRRRSRD